MVYKLILLTIYSSPNLFQKELPVWIREEEKDKKEKKKIEEKDEKHIKTDLKYES